MTPPPDPPGGNAWQVSAEAADPTRHTPAPRPVTVPAQPKRVTFDLARTAPIAPPRRLLPVPRAATVPIVWVNWGTRPDRANISPAFRLPGGDIALFLDAPANRRR